MVVLALVCAAHGAFLPREVHSQEHPTVSAAVADARPGSIANRMNPGDPIAQVVVAGFPDLASAAAFVDAAFVAGKTPPVFQQTLARGQSVRFVDAARPLEAAYLVIYFHDEHGRPVLLSMTRAHTDIPLAIGSCGYQVLLGVDTGAAPGAAPKEYPIR